MDYEHTFQWVKVANLINNRVKTLNFMLSSPDGSASASVVYKRGSYRVLVAGSVFARYGVYDVDGAESALVRVSALCDGLWLARRSSLSFT